MKKTLLSLGVCATLLSCCVLANATSYTATINVVNKTGYPMAITMLPPYNNDPANAHGTCTVAWSAIVCTTDSSGKLAASASIMINNDFSHIAQLYMYNPATSQGNFYLFYTPFPPYNWVLSTSTWDGQSNTTLSLTVTNNY